MADFVAYEKHHPHLAGMLRMFRAPVLVLPPPNEGVGLRGALGRKHSTPVFGRVPLGAVRLGYLFGLNMADGLKSEAIFYLTALELGILHRLEADAPCLGLDCAHVVRDGMCVVRLGGHDSAPKPNARMEIFRALGYLRDGTKFITPELVGTLLAHPADVRRAVLAGLIDGNGCRGKCQTCKVTLFARALSRRPSRTTRPGVFPAFGAQPGPALQRLPALALERFP